MLTRLYRLRRLLSFLALALCSAAGGEPAQPAPSPEPPSGTEPDRDPLPPGAIARLGRVRFRQAGLVRLSVFSPDGKTLVTEGADKTIGLWDVATGKPLLKFEGHTNEVRSVAISPDGRMLASGGDDMTVRLWDVATGKERLKSEVQPGSIWSVAFSPDGRTLASGGVDGVVRLWDVATGKETLSFGRRPGTVMSVAYVPDGKTLVTGNADNSVRLWEAATGKELRECLGHEASVMTVGVSPDGSMLASGSYDQTIRLWDVATGKSLYELTGHQGMILSVAFSPDGRTLVSGSYDQTVRLWEVATGTVLRTLEGHGAKVRTLAVSPDGKRLASGDTNATLLLWNLDSLLVADADASKPAEGLWEDLASRDATRAMAGVVRLAQGGGDAVRFIRGRLERPSKDVDVGRLVRQAIADLDGDDFAVREKAEQELLSLGTPAVPALREAVQETASAEMRLRGGRVLELLQHPFPIPPGEPLRRWRAINVLERIGSAEAREVLGVLEKESPSQRERREAAAACERLRRRQPDE